MSLDAGYLKCIVKQLNQTVQGLKVDKVYQPQRDEIILQLRGYRGTFLLLLSANASNARAGLTDKKPANPSSPPMFCMLLRKHLLGAVLSSVQQQGFDRVLILAFEGYNELSDKVKRYLAVEIMARHSNIILYDEQTRIIDAVKHIDFTVSSQRQVLPGLFYLPAPTQQKANPLTLSKEEIREIILKGEGQKKCDKFLLEQFSGLSPIVFREAVFRACGHTDVLMSQMDEQTKEKLFFHFYGLIEIIREENFFPVLVSDVTTRRPVDFCFAKIHQYGTAAIEKTFDDPSLLLDAFYFKRDNMERTRQKGQDLLKIVTNAVERTSRKLNNQMLELEQAKGREHLKICADLIMANLYRLEKGEDKAVLENFYSESHEKIEISLNSMLSPSQNAQKYYKEYQKAKTKERYLTVQIQKAQDDIVYLESIFDNMSKAETESDFAQIKQELIQQGYISKGKDKQDKKKKREATKPLSFLSDDGFMILVGKNNLQNDELTLRTASKRDIWFHTKEIPGSHTVILTDGKEVPDRTLTQAAVLAATYSKAKDSRNVSVDFTKIKNVKKPAGARPGMVIYDFYETAYVNPDDKLAEKLRKK